MDGNRDGFANLQRTCSGDQVIIFPALAKRQRRNEDIFQALRPIDGLRPDCRKIPDIIESETLAEAGAIAPKTEITFGGEYVGRFAGYGDRTHGGKIPRARCGFDGFFHQGQS